MRYNFIDKRLFVVGDIHGDFKLFFSKILNENYQNSVFIIAGDVGIGFERKNYYSQLFQKYKKKFISYGIVVLGVRGNHDSPEYFNNKTIDLPYFKTIPDYSVVNLQYSNEKREINVLCVGGATSIDRILRIHENDKAIVLHKMYNSKDSYIKKFYWEDEAPIFDENQLDKLNDKNVLIDFVVSHTAPSFCQLLTKDGIKNWMIYDQDLEKDVDNERQTMDKIFNKLKKDYHPLKGWVYGHFHKHVNENIDGIQYTMLDCIQNRLDVYEIDCISNGRSIINAF